MVAFSAIAALVVAAAGAASARRCQNITIPVTISARNAVFNVAVPQTNIAVTEFMINLSQQDSNYSAALLTGYATVSGDYKLAATYCAPDHGAGKTLQILTHGIGFDRSYWDIPLNNYNYSYVETAVDQYGFSTLSYDRLGIGQSQHGEPVNEIQSSLEIAALTAVTKLARARKIPGVKDSFKKVVHVGHSFGSIQSFALARNEPKLSDGLILTGFAMNGSFLPFFELGGNFVSVTSVPAAASKYVAGYFAAGNPSGVQTNFFAPGQFDPAALDLAYRTGQPVTVGELLTIGTAAGGVSQFCGPVLVITGSRDLPFCGGDCLATGDPALASIPAGVQKFLPAASRYETFIVPNAGHGLNYEYSHETTFQHISQFLVGNGLA
jgi:pimeloyl-ACP methyl ester carboxylesterase